MDYAGDGYKVKQEVAGVPVCGSHEQLAQLQASRAGFPTVRGRIQSGDYENGYL